jgi:hypothetical protein
MGIDGLAPVTSRESFADPGLADTALAASISFASLLAACADVGVWRPAVAPPLASALDVPASTTAGRPARLGVSSAGPVDLGAGAITGEELRTSDAEGPCPQDPQLDARPAGQLSAIAPLPAELAGPTPLQVLPAATVIAQSGPPAPRSTMTASAGSSPRPLPVQTEPTGPTAGWPTAGARAQVAPGPGNDRSEGGATATSRLDRRRFERSLSPDAWPEEREAGGQSNQPRGLAEPSVPDGVPTLAFGGDSGADPAPPGPTTASAPNDAPGSAPDQRAPWSGATAAPTPETTLPKRGLGRVAATAAPAPEDCLPTRPTESRRGSDARFADTAAAASTPITGQPANAPRSVDGTAPARPASTGQLVDTLVRQARLLVRDGGTMLEVEIDPPTLGRVVIEAVADAAGLQLILIPTRPEAVLVLAGALPSLERALAATVGGPIRARLEPRSRPEPAAPPPPGVANHAPAGALNVTV